MRVALELQLCCGGKRSGIGSYTYEIAKHVRSGDGIEFCGNLFNFLGRNDNSEALAGIDMPIRTCGAFPYGIYRRIWHFVPVRYQQLFREPADLSVFFNYTVPPRVSGRVVTTIYDMTHVRFPETVHPRNMRRIKSGGDRSVMRSEAILTISEFSKREIVELLDIEEGYVYVAPCAPSLTSETADFDACAAKFGIKKPYLLYVGTIEPRKNLTRLLRAFSLLKREQGIAHQLVLAGGKGWLNDEIYKTAEGVPDAVFTGYISGAEKNALYQNAAAFVFPSLYEGFGIPPLEAMTFGCPVICADAASLPEVVGDAAELVDPYDETGIAQGIWNVISSEARAAELSRKGRERAKRFTWDESARRFERMCRDVLRATWPANPRGSEIRQP